MIAKRKHFKKDDSADSKLLPVILGVLFLAIVGFLIVSNYRINKKRTEMQNQIKSLQDQIKELEDKKANLQAGISIGESAAFLEREARDELGLKKPGEEVVAVLPAEGGQGSVTPTEKSLWQKILQFLHLRQ